MPKPIEKILDHMKEYVSRDYAEVDGIMSGWNRAQYEVAQKATGHWLKLLLQATDLPSKDSDNG